MGGAVDDPRVVQGFTATDWTNWPQPVKVYPPGLPRTPLPRELAAGRVPATRVLAGHTVVPRRLDLRRSRGCSTSRPASSGSGTGPRRTDRCSSSVRRVRPARASPWSCTSPPAAIDGLDDGVHWYDPLEHALVRVGPPAADGVTTLVVTGVPWRTSWRYVERGFRHSVLGRRHDARAEPGAAASAGLPWRLVPGVPGRRRVGAGRRGRPARVPARRGRPRAGEPATGAGGAAAEGVARPHVRRVPAGGGHAARGRRPGPWVPPSPTGPRSTIGWSPAYPPRARSTR